MTTVNDFEVPIERFDEFFQGAPEEIERRLQTLRPQALCHSDTSLAPQIESQIALAQAMQQRFTEAFETLDRAEQLLGADAPSARVRLLLERGRVFHQMRRMTEALPWMLASYEQSRANGLDYHAVNAAHMTAIVSDAPIEKIRWNQLALQVVEASTEARTQAWGIVLHNNIGQAYIAAGRFEDALAAFQECHRLATQQGNALVERGARWGIARAQRSLGARAEALAMQRQLLDEYEKLEREDAMPLELLRMARGMVYEELCELAPDKSCDFATLAVRDLGVNSWFRDLEPERWSCLLRLASRETGETMQEVPDVATRAVVN